MKIDRILIAGAVLALVMMLGLGLQTRAGLTCMDEHAGAGLCHRLVRGQ